jgi:hypothetical protein
MTRDELILKALGATVVEMLSFGADDAFAEAWCEADPESVVCDVDDIPGMDMVQITGDTVTVALDSGETYKVTFEKVK